MRKEKEEKMKVLEILELVKKQLFMTEKGLVSIETLADKAIAEVKAMQERIKELEEAMKHKTCKGCVHEVGDMQDLHCAFCSRSCDDNFEPKDNA